jgi:hypothetical protein
MFHYHALYFNSKKGDRVKRRSAPGLGHIKTIDLFNISCYFEETVIQKFYNELADEEEKTEEENTEDLMFLHILDCIGCIGNLTHYTHADSLTKSKRSVFWKAVRKIADLELKNLSQREKEEREEEMEMVTVDLHNSVNKQLGKPRFTESDSIAFYSRLGALGRSPVITTEDFAEADMRAILRGFGLGVAVTAVCGATVWYVSKGDS